MRRSTVLSFPFSKYSLDRLLALVIDISLGWKGLPETNTNIFDPFVSNEEKNYNMTPGPKVIRLFKDIIYNYSQ